MLWNHGGPSRPRVERDGLSDRDLLANVGLEDAVEVLILGY